MTRSSRVWCTLAAICTGTLFFGKAIAAEFTLSGEVTVATGAFEALTPVGTPVAGPIVIDDVALGGIAGPGDIISIDVNVGGFCFSTEDPSACPLGGADVPIVSIDGAAIDLTSLPVVGGFLDVTAFSPTFGINIPIMFDLGAGTFFADGGALGTVSGTVELRVVPIPAAAWLFGSAMLGLFGLRRRS